MLKFRVLISAALLMAFAASAPTQTDWIGRFLDRYKPLNSASVPQSADEPWRLMVQQSALPISISDVIQLMHASNLDVNVNRFNPITKQYLLNTLLQTPPTETKSSISLMDGSGRNPTVGSSEGA